MVRHVDSSVDEDATIQCSPKESMTVMMTKKRMMRIKKMKKRRRTTMEITVKTAEWSDTGSVTIWSSGTE